MLLKNANPTLNSWPKIAGPFQQSWKTQTDAGPLLHLDEACAGKSARRADFQGGEGGLLLGCPGCAFKESRLLIAILEQWKDLETIDVDDEYDYDKFRFWLSYDKRWKEIGLGETKRLFDKVEKAVPGAGAANEQWFKDVEDAAEKRCAEILTERKPARPVRPGDTYGLMDFGDLRYQSAIPYEDIHPVRIIKTHARKQLVVISSSKTNLEKLAGSRGVTIDIFPKVPAGEKEWGTIEGLLMSGTEIPMKDLVESVPEVIKTRQVKTLSM